YTGALQDSFDPISYSSSTLNGGVELSASPGYGFTLTIDANKLNLLATLVPGLFIPDTQSDIVTMIGSTLNIANIESADDVEAELVSSEEDEEENGSALVCS
ncbi:MAG: hypothetical protein DRQ44_11500, partial [Gammaproteobacteria bacterium]